MSDNIQTKRSRKSLPSWSCPVCFDELGVDEGVVPCAMTACRPILHIVCLNCTDSLKKDDKGATLCPVCRRASEAVPLADFISPDDHEAEVKMNCIKFFGEANNDGSLSALVKKSREEAAEMKNEHAELVQQRVNYVVKKVNESIASGAPARYGAGGYINITTKVPSFDEKNVTLRCSAPGFRRRTREQVIKSLAEIAKEINPHIRAIFEDSPYEVSMREDQWVWPENRTANSLKKPVYMKVCIKPRSN